MSADAIITVEGLGKRYRLGAGQSTERYTALRDVISEKAAGFFKKLKPEKPKAGNGSNVNVSEAQRPSVSRAGRADFWALKDVSFEVKQGEVLGIIGRNGAGKSTLLKILSRITEPTEGRIKIKGRVASLLEVGTGFHPELTGRENIFLNGAILGMHRHEIRAKFDEIVAFAEVEKFLDTPVKRYSSGMYVRLAFAVAAHLEPEILIIDEVLAVGDAEFQKKCLGKMRDVASGRRTVLFVSHQLAQIRRLCDTAVWVDAGRVLASGQAPLALAKYEAAVFATGSAVIAGRHYALEFVGWLIADAGGEQSNVYDGRGPVQIELRLHVNRELRHGHHTVALYRGSDLIWGMEVQNFFLKPGSVVLRYTFPNLPIQSGVYEWRWGFHDERGVVDSFSSQPLMHIETAPAVKARDEWTGILNVPCSFAYEITNDR
jgi:lipopolysaccharide transport system ATP-binding protein